ncbi:MAG: dihydrolipoyl dehydrogenase [Thermoplasmatales archaeon]|nr:dihydrolipoyl dehydrogenase [Candidatus Thermoplasmatota archaeon]MCL6003072.1 dihydrolipoyl dehydrogenase [Candidatus Thermoplasmatota archaeon]MDA8054670.1 dihydrolipoyl dehydrogenase [Thermoplasmatales archaeon]
MEYDAIILGGGPGGYSTAIRLGQNGKKALMIEADKVGGECLNYGCIPSKAVIEMADAIAYLKEMPGVSSSVTIDMKKWQEWKWGMINKLTSGVEKLVKSYGGEVVMGRGVIENSRSVKVNNETFSAKNIVIATGSIPSRIKGIDDVYYNKNILDVDHIPKSLIIIGGGYIGVELGTAFAKLGSEVTIIEMMPNILPGTDTDLSRFVDRRMSTLGIKVIVGAKVDRVTKEAGYSVSLSDGNVLKAELVVMTVGRQPNTQGFGLEKINPEMDGKFIKTDKRKRTSVEGVYAVGDVSGQPMLAHKAFYDAEIAADNISGKNAEVDYRAMPFVIYSDPEIATTGIKTDKFNNIPLATNGRALGMNYNQGVFRIYVDNEFVIKGGAFVAPRASELISEISLAVEAGLTSKDLGMTVHPHPTLSEGVKEAAEATYGRSLHYKSSR